jgi:hypothetical protein
VSNQVPGPANRGGRPPNAGRPYTGLSLKTVAVLAFIVGVALHGCVALTILGSNGDSDDDPGIDVTSPGPSGPGSPTQLPDRTSCDEIRGTEYRSDAEREFFQANCVSGVAPRPAARPPSDRAGLQPAIDPARRTPEAEASTPAG